MEIEFNSVSLVVNSRTYAEKLLLKNVSFKLESGKKYCFLGNSNSGKSVIGDLINGVVKPSKGSVRIGEFVNDGRNIKNVNSLRFDVGVVYKNKDDMFFNKKVKDELEFAMKFFKYKTNKKVVRSIEALKIVGLGEEYLNKNIDDLSLSEAKKVGLASVLVYNPRVIILDEPTLHFNSREKRELIRILNFINEKYGKTIIVMSRDVDFIYEFNSNILVLSNGELVMQGNNDIFYDENKLSKYDISSPLIVTFSNLVRSKYNKNFKYYKSVLDLVKGVCNDVL